MSVDPGERQNLAEKEKTQAASLDERQALRREVPRAGLGARLVGRTLAELACDLVVIADVAALEMIIGTFASVTTGATAMAFGVKPKPARN